MGITSSLSLAGRRPLWAAVSNLVVWRCLRRGAGVFIPPAGAGVPLLPLLFSSEFGLRFGAPSTLAVFLGAGGTSGLARDCRLGAGPAFALCFSLYESLILSVSLVLFALGPLVSFLVVFAALLPALLNFE